MEDKNGHNQFLTEVFPAELLEIKRRRKEVFGELNENDKNTIDEKSKPATNLGLIGLSLSGGGIRSATFSLGVLQALSRRGVLKYVDYLSTVSGGGYIGSCLSSVLNNPKTGTENEEFPFQHKKGEIEPDAFKHLRRNSNYVAPGGILDYLRIPAVLLRGVLINLFVILPYVFFAVMLTQGGLICYHKIFGEDKPINTLQSIIIWSMIGLFLLLTFTFPIVSDFCKNKLKWDRRNKYELLFGVSVLIILSGLIMISIPAALKYYKAWDNATITKSLAAIAAFSTTLFTGKAAEKVSKWKGKLILYATGMIGPLILFIAYLHFCDQVLHPVCTLKRSVFFYGIGLLLFIYTRLFVDVNAISLHNFYRDRLSKAYLFKVGEKGNDVMLNDEQKLSELNAGRTKAPYHLINASLNLPDAKNIDLRIRNADFFIFSKHFYGSLSTGYYNTAYLEKKVDPHVNLGTAMAISGAAASPNMGSTTIKPLVFIMALLNVRLGYWIPNPRKLRKNGYRWLHFRGVRPLYLIKELVTVHPLV